MIAPYREKGIVLDIGTGDGRFVSAQAKANPEKFFIGIDANAKALEKLSMSATRKSAKGGLPNVIFVQAAVEDLPGEFYGIANRIHINFPWGSLLRAVAAGDAEILRSLRRIAAHECHIDLVIGIDPTRDRGELERLGIPELSGEFDTAAAVAKYRAAGFVVVEHRELKREEWAHIETSWARKLGGSDSRRVFRFRFTAI